MPTETKMLNWTDAGWSCPDCGAIIQRGKKKKKKGGGSSSTDRFKVGDSVTPTKLVNVRANPAGDLLGTHNVGETGVVKAGPVAADFNEIPVNWYYIEWPTDPTNGWSGDDNLTNKSDS
jgi:rubredoxin